MRADPAFLSEAQLAFRGFGAPEPVPGRVARAYSRARLLRQELMPKRPRTSCENVTSDQCRRRASSTEARSAIAATTWRKAGSDATGTSAERDASRASSASSPPSPCSMARCKAARSCSIACPWRRAARSRDGSAPASWRASMAPSDTGAAAAAFVPDGVPAEREKPPAACAVLVRPSPPAVVRPTPDMPLIAISLHDRPGLPCRPAASAEMPGPLSSTFARPAVARALPRQVQRLTRNPFPLATEVPLSRLSRLILLTLALAVLAPVSQATAQVRIKDIADVEG